MGQFFFSLVEWLRTDIRARAPIVLSDTSTGTGTPPVFNLFVGLKLATAPGYCWGVRRG